MIGNLDLSPNGITNYPIKYLVMSRGLNKPGYIQIKCWVRNPGERVGQT